MAEIFSKTVFFCFFAFIALFPLLVNYVSTKERLFFIIKYFCMDFKQRSIKLTHKIVFWLSQSVKHVEKVYWTYKALLSKRRSLQSRRHWMFGNFHFSCVGWMHQMCIFVSFVFTPDEENNAADTDSCYWDEKKKKKPEQVFWILKNVTAQIRNNCVCLNPSFQVFPESVFKRRYFSSIDN